MWQAFSAQASQAPGNALFAVFPAIEQIFLRQLFTGLLRLETRGEIIARCLSLYIMCTWLKTYLR
jgi:hypothetical protein